MRSTPYCRASNEPRILAEVEKAVRDSLTAGNSSAALMHFRTFLTVLSSLPNATENIWKTPLDLAYKLLKVCKNDSNSVTSLTDLCFLIDSFPPAKFNGILTEAYDALGVAQMNSQDLEAALVSFHKAASITKLMAGSAADRAGPYFHLSEAYFRRRNFKQAVRYGSQASIYAEQFRPEDSHVTERLNSLYLILAQCEEALHRPDRANYWIQRSDSGKTLKVPDSTPTSPVGFHRFPERRETSLSRASPISPSHSNWLIATKNSSVNRTLKRGNQTPQAHICQQDMERIDEDSPWTRTKFKRGSLDALSNYLQPPRRRKSKATLKVLPGADDEFGRTVLVADGQDLQSPQTPGRVSLKIQSKVSDNQDSLVIYECWRKLASRPQVHIIVAKGPSDSWVISLQDRDGGLRIEESLDSSHPWRQFQAHTLASLLDLGPNGQLVLHHHNSTRSVSKQNIEIFRETREFMDGTFEIRYETDSSLHRVEIKARGDKKTLLKTVCNDINLASHEELLAYIRVTLSPKIRIINDQIVVAGSSRDFESLKDYSTRLSFPSPDQTDNIQTPLRASSSKVFQTAGRLIYIGKVTLSPSTPATVSVLKFNQFWAIKATLIQSGKILRLEATDSDVQNMCQWPGSKDEVSLAKQLVSLLVLDKGSKLGFANSKAEGRMIITISEDQSAPKVYQRDYHLVTETVQPGAELAPIRAAELAPIPAAIRIQAFVRMFQAKRRTTLLALYSKHHKLATIVQRIGVAIQQEYYVINVLKAGYTFAQLLTMNVRTKETHVVGVRTPHRNLSDKSECLKTISELEKEIIGTGERGKKVDRKDIIERVQKIKKMRSSSDL